MENVLDKEYFVKYLKEKNLTCLIVDKNNQIVFSDDFYGIRPFNYLFHKQLDLLKDSTAYVYEIGGAASTFLILGKIKNVYAINLSKQGLKLLSENKVDVEYENLVDYIYARKDKVCPMEQISIDYQSNLEIIKEKVEAFIQELKKAKESSSCSIR